MLHMRGRSVCRWPVTFTLWGEGNPKAKTLIQNPLYVRLPMRERTVCGWPSTCRSGSSWRTIEVFPSSVEQNSSRCAGICAAPPPTRCCQILALLLVSLQSCFRPQGVDKRRAAQGHSCAAQDGGSFSRTLLWTHPQRMPAAMRSPLHTPASREPGLRSPNTRSCRQALARQLAGEPSTTPVLAKAGVLGDARLACSTTAGMAGER